MAQATRIRLPANISTGPVMMHSDAARTHALAVGGRTRRELLSCHIEIVRSILDGRDIWVPTFNYDFLRTGMYLPESDRSQVGPINDFIRTEFADWRTSCPVFNFAGTGEHPVSGVVDGTAIDPFDATSAFGALIERDGSVLWYGAPFASSTIIHHIERVSGGPAYRYDKIFRGTVELKSGQAARVSLRYHVRPWQQHLDYDWGRLRGDLIKQQVLSEIDRPTGLAVAPARLMAEFWRAQLMEDPLYLLDERSRLWVSAKLDQLGRRFMLDDFEEVEP